MRLKHIYITKEGEPMANPEMEYPTEPIEDDDGELILNDSCPNCHTEYDAIDAEYQICHLCKFDSSHEAELQRYHSGLLPFEDENAKYYLPVKARYSSHHEPQDEEYLLTPQNRKEAIEFHDEVLLKPDTIIPVDIEVEVVTKEQEEWSDETGAFMIEYKVLRIKP